MSIKLGKLLKDVRNTDLIITPTLNEWLMLHGDDPYPQEVVDLIAKELAKKPRNRSGTFSASSAGTCLRAQELAVLGVPSGDTIDPGLQMIFVDGKWRHLRWQAMLLTAGLLDRMEFAQRWKAMRAYGTLDGIGTVADDHARSYIRGMEYGFELKGVNPWDWHKAVKQDKGTKEAHRNQIARYHLMTGLDLFVTIYENKATQEWFEWVDFPDENYVAASLKELEEGNKHLDRERLAPMLPSCKIQTGPVWDDCPYGGAGNAPCPRAGKWPRLKKGKNK